MQSQEQFEMWDNLLRSKGLWTEEETAKAWGCSKSTVSRTKNGKIKAVDRIEDKLDKTFRVNPDRPAVWPSEQYKRFKEHCGVTKSELKNAEWDKKYLPRCVEESPKMSRKEAAERIKKIIQKYEETLDILVLKDKKKQEKKEIQEAYIALDMLTQS
jgi:hypothetical protein